MGKHIRVLAPAERVEVSAGSAFANHRLYDPEAVVPREPWRTLSAAELVNMFVTDIAAPDLQPVVLFDVDCALVAQLRTLLRVTSTVARLELCRTVYKEIGDYLRQRYAADALIVHGIASHPPALPTVTRESHRRSHIGMHVDSWDALPLSLRTRSFPRICINLGAEARFFYFVDVPLMTAAELSDATDAEVRTIPRRFLTRHPHYPVTRLRIDPGEAYLAWTDNVIHDAKGPDRVTDYTFTVRGSFDYRKIVGSA